MAKNKNLTILLILVLIVAAVGAGAFFLQRTDTRGADPGREVRVYLDGKLYATGNLGESREITVRQEDGSVNVIRLDDQGVWMESSTCHNQLCVAQGKVTYDNFRSRYYGTNIICLPNRVTVELVVREEERDPDAPDI